MSAISKGKLVRKQIGVLTMNRKGEGTGIIWAIAIVAIVLASLIFILGILFLNNAAIVKNTLGFGNKNSPITIAQDTGSNIVLQKNFQSFLNKKINFEGDKITILEFAKNSDLNSEEYKKFFKNEAENFFDKTLPYPLEGWYGVHPYWIRIYNKQDEIDESTNYIGAGAYSCKAFDETSITLTHFSENKKIVLCIIRDYYDSLEVKKIE